MECQVCHKCSNKECEMVSTLASLVSDNRMRPRIGTSKSFKLRIKKKTDLKLKSSRIASARLHSKIRPVVACAPNLSQSKSTSKCSATSFSYSRRTSSAAMQTSRLTVRTAADISCPPVQFASAQSPCLTPCTSSRSSRHSRIAR